MAYDASDILGATQVASARARARAKRFIAGHATPVPPELVWPAFLAATADELALVAINQKSLTGKLSDVLARVPRSEVASIDYDGDFISKLTIWCTDESRWDVDVAKGGGKACKPWRTSSTAEPSPRQPGMAERISAISSRSSAASS